MRVRGTKRLLALGLMVAGALGFAASARSQAYDTMQRPADLLVFGGFSYTTPDYGFYHNTGGSFGVDYDRSFGWRLIPGLEVRANLTSGPVVTEHSYVGGFRAHMNLAHRFHPYGDVLAGLGQITYSEYNTFLVHDTGVAYEVGAGVDVDFAHNLMVKADYQYQFWNLGQNAYTQPDGSNFTLNPRIFTVGVTYRIPFRPWRDGGHNHD